MVLPFGKPPNISALNGVVHRWISVGQFLSTDYNPQEVFDEIPTIFGGLGLGFPSSEAAEGASVTRWVAFRPVTSMSRQPCNREVTHHIWHVNTMCLRPLPLHGSPGLSAQHPNTGWGARRVTC